MKKTTQLSLLALVGALVLSANLAAGATPALRYIGTLADNSLSTPSGLALDSDGDHLYVGSTQDDALTVFRRDDDTGELHHVETHVDGDGGINGLIGILDVALSPDGRSVYAASPYNEAVAVFERNPHTGRLIFLEYHRDGSDGVHGLEGAASVAVSPDGLSVYVASRSSHAIAHFDRDPVTGRLDHRGSLYDGVQVPDGLAGACTVVVSPDGAQVYAGSNEDNAVVVLARAAGSGNVSYVETHQNGLGGLSDLDYVVDLVLSPDGAHLYAVALHSYAINLFERSPTTGRLTHSGVAQEGHGGVHGMAPPMSAALSPDGRYLHVGSLPSLHVFERNPTSGQLTLAHELRGNLIGREGFDEIIGIAASPDGRHLYTSSYGDGILGVYRRDLGTGALSLRAWQRCIDGLEGVVGLAVSPQDDRVFVTANDGDSLVVFDRDSATGALAWFETLREGDDGLTGLNGARDVVVSDNGRDVYVAAYAGDMISLFQPHSDGSGYFLRDTVEDGPGVSDLLNGPQALDLSPNDRHLYVVCPATDALLVFRRSGSTGTLGFVMAVVDDVGTTRNLDGAYDVAVSPDGDWVFVASYDEHAITVLERDATDGSVTWRGSVRDGGGGTSGLLGANSVAVSPDGAQIFVAGRTQGTLVILDWQPDAGGLSWRAKLDSTDAPGMSGARAVAISRDGRRVYVASQWSNAVVVFAREPGEPWPNLTYLETWVDDLHGVDGLRTANGLALSRDDRTLYVSGYDDDAVAIFGTRASVYLPVVLR